MTTIKYPPVDGTSETPLYDVAERGPHRDAHDGGSVDKDGRGLSLRRPPAPLGPVDHAQVARVPVGGRQGEDEGAEGRVRTNEDREVAGGGRGVAQHQHGNQAWRASEGVSLSRRFTRRVCFVCIMYTYMMSSFKLFLRQEQTKLKIRPQPTNYIRTA